MKETLTFKIDGEWLTDFVRRRYWYEGLSYQEAFDLCKSILVPYGTEPDEAFTNVINGILTGTMKLEGVNSFDVVEDNKFSEYTKYLGRLELAKRKADFKEHLRLHPENYIDPASTKKSLKAYLELPAVQKEYTTREGILDWYRYFVKDEGDPWNNKDYDWDSEDHLFGGCYMLMSPDTAGNLLNWKPVETEQDKVAYIDKLYNYWEEMLKDPYLEESAPHYFLAIRSRQKFALALKRKTKLTDTDQLIENEVKKSKRVKSTRILQEKEGHKVIRKEIILFDAQNLHPLEFYDGDVEEYWAVPDPDFSANLGLISPQGDFYGCTFASHLFLAQHLIERDPAMHKEFLAKYGNRILAEDRSLDFLLLDKGWIAIRNAYGGVGQVDLGKYSSEDELPQRMLDAVWDYRVRRRDKDG